MNDAEGFRPPAPFTCNSVTEEYGAQMSVIPTAFRTDLIGEGCGRRAKFYSPIKSGVNLT